jgi:predicted enzyme related to lactoylglutathione lyase
MAEPTVFRPGGVSYLRYVNDVRATLDRALANGAEPATAPYPEGNLTVATFRDPAGSEIGVWQQNADA